MFDVLRHKSSQGSDDNPNDLVLWDRVVYKDHDTPCMQWLSSAVLKDQCYEIFRLIFLLLARMFSDESRTDQIPPRFCGARGFRSLYGVRNRSQDTDCQAPS
jgi:hypothetical protein